MGVAKEAERQQLRWQGNGDEHVEVGSSEWDVTSSMPGTVAMMIALGFSIDALMFLAADAAASLAPSGPLMAAPAAAKDPGWPPTRRHPTPWTLTP